MSRARTAPRAASSALAASTAVRLSFLAFLLYAISGGGRVVGSDEVTMFELSRALARGTLAVPPGATVAGPEGRHYSKNAAGQAVLALPLVVVSEGVARATGLEPARRTLATRFGASFFNAVVTAVLIGAFYAGARRLGVGSGAALAATALLGFASPLWVYAKSFMAEPLQALGLWLALIGSCGVMGPGWAGIGVFLAVSAKLSMLPLAGACVAPLLLARPATWRFVLAGLVLALAGHALYNFARFGSPMETGYGVQATPSAFGTPLWVGLYGLLLSSGKGVMWFAPALWLVPRGVRSMMHRSKTTAAGIADRIGLAAPPGCAAWGAALAWGAGLILYGSFQHWAGDGSFGPRYLIPLLPLAFLPVAFAMDGRSVEQAPAGASSAAAQGAGRPEPRPGGPRAVRAAAVLLGLAGFLVQIGGVGIYFGAQMREAGDYPYRLPLEDPRSLSDSHFNPAFSPIVGHWHLLIRNLGGHLRGNIPRISADGEPDPRLGVNRKEQAALLHGLDFWWLYLRYAGFPRGPVAIAMIALLLLAGWAAMRARAAVTAETLPR